MAWVCVILIQAQLPNDGDWDLRPLRTENQKKPYSPVTLTSFGFEQNGVSRIWRIGLELSYVKTFGLYGRCEHSLC